jgi:glycosyltransferase involved in cell wall biosynthesis
MTGVRALHLFGNFKWTGPADPAIRCARGLRRLGADVLFAQAAARDGNEHRIATELRRERMPVTGDLRLPKHFSPFASWHDGRALANRLRRGDFNLLHANLPSDHVSASLAKRMAGSAVLVRSIHEPDAPKKSLRNRFAFGNTDGVVVPTTRCAEQMAKRFGFGMDCIHVQEPTTDWGRFDRLDGDLREQWGLSPENIVIGITARVQPHRRFEFLWDVARQVIDESPHARFVLLGRGHPDHLRDLVHAPIERRGLSEHVILPGYLHEPEYSLALKTLDLFVFLVPGSDGTCRAVREALAAGAPVVTTQRGILPDMLTRRYEGAALEACGLTIEEDVTQMSQALTKLIKNPDARENLRAAARARVTELMDEGKAARRLLAFYETLRGESK